MDFFQGSAPPNFISFRLGNENTEEGQTPASDPNIQSASNVMPSPPPLLPIRAPISPSSTDRNVDVTAYAEEMVRVYEHTQGLVTTLSTDQTAKDSGKTGQPEEVVRGEVMQNQEGTTDASHITLAQTDPVPSIVRNSTRMLFRRWIRLS